MGGRVIVHQGGALASPKKGLRVVIPEGSYDLTAVDGGVILSSDSRGYFLEDADFFAYLDDGQISMKPSSPQVDTEKERQR
jgi:hypothetical protein